MCAPFVMSCLVYGCIQFSSLLSLRSFHRNYSIYFVNTQRKLREIKRWSAPVMIVTCSYNRWNDFVWSNKTSRNGNERLFSRIRRNNFVCGASYSRQFSWTKKLYLLFIWMHLTYQVDQFLDGEISITPWNNAIWKKSRRKRSSRNANKNKEKTTEFAHESLYCFWIEVAAHVRALDDNSNIFDVINKHQIENNENSF